MTALRTVRIKVSVSALACSSFRSLGRRSRCSFKGRRDERRLGSGRAMNISWLSKLPAACEYGIPSGGLDRGRTYHDGAEDGLRYDGPVEHKRATQGRAAFLIYQNATLNKIWVAFEVWLSELLLLIVYGQTSFFQSQFVFCQFFNGKSICERNRFVISDTFARKN